jgi:uncharacterized protein
MAYDWMEIAATPGVKAAQEANGSAELWQGFAGERPSSRFTQAEASFIAARDSFYLATVSEAGWPYIQHRGGPPGFLRVIDDHTLACADFRGNRQYVSIGNLATNDRASLFLMDYPNRRRLKIFAHVEPVELGNDEALLAAVASPGYRAKVERALRFRLEAFDWNCPQHITPRFTEAELANALAPVRAHIEELEAENAALKARLEGV